MWKSFDPTTLHFEGVKTSGDTRVPPTTKWNKLFLIWFVWKRRALMFVNQTHANAGYRVGFYDKFGTCMVSDRIMHDRFFFVRVGHEPCIFFALDPSMNTEVPFKLLKEIDRGEEGDYRGAPLI